MGFILLLLSCWGAVVHDLPFVRISDNSPIDVFVVGEPKQQYQWKVTPTVRVCKTTEMPLYRVQQAIHYWENLGYNFDGIYYDSKPDCMEPRFGEIIITLPEAGFSDAHIAATRVYTRIKSGEIAKVKIFILPKHTKKPRVLEHEIGHALGWKHYPQKFHIMHPEWELSGYANNGVRKR
tara:strand:+ start:19 stop:555 length:537 start_codon:yes stop_codon:yes gene_type:complete